MDMDVPNVDLEGQGHRSKVKVTRSKNIISGLVRLFRQVMYEDKGPMGQGQRSCGSRSTLKVIILAGGLTSTSSCIFIFYQSLTTCTQRMQKADPHTPLTQNKVSTKLDFTREMNFIYPENLPTIPVYSILDNHGNIADPEHDPQVLTVERSIFIALKFNFPVGFRVIFGDINRGFIKYFFEQRTHTHSKIEKSY